MLPFCFGPRTDPLPIDCGAFALRNLMLDLFWALFMSEICVGCSLLVPHRGQGLYSTDVWVLELTQRPQLIFAILSS